MVGKRWMRDMQDIERCIKNRATEGERDRVLENTSSLRERKKDSIHFFFSHLTLFSSFTLFASFLPFISPWEAGEQRLCAEWDRFEKRERIERTQGKGNLSLQKSSMTLQKEWKGRKTFSFKAWGSLQYWRLWSMERERNREMRDWQGWRSLET